MDQSEHVKAMMKGTEDGVHCLEGWCLLAMAITGDLHLGVIEFVCGDTAFIKTIRAPYRNQWDGSYEAVRLGDLSRWNVSNSHTTTRLFPTLEQARRHHNASPFKRGEI